MMFYDPTPAYFVYDGQFNAFATTQPAYFAPSALDAQGTFSLLAHHSTNTLGTQVAYDSTLSSQEYKASSEVDDLIDITNLLYTQEITSEETQGPIADIASSLQNSLPSPPQPESPTMYRTEQLPGISTLSGEIASLQAHLLPPVAVKKQYPFYPSAPQRVQPHQHSHAHAHAHPSLPLPLPSLPGLPCLTRTPPHPPKRVIISSPESSPCSSPPLSPKRGKKNYTKEFNGRFHELLNNNEQATNEWHVYAQRHKGRCTIKRAPCIKVSRGFCASFGREFTDLAKEEKYGALGTRTECGCMHKPQPLSSGPVKRQRQSTRSAPYPAAEKNPGTPQEPELPCADSSSPLTKQAWISFLLQSAPILHEGFNTFMGGMQCASCNARRAFASRDEIIAYLMREPIPCTQGCCAGHMQVHQ